MRTELSILIPTYNGDCRQQVSALLRQASAIEGLTFEIVVADDHSPDRSLASLCRETGRWPHCRFIGLEANVGRAAIRNLLAREARYDWLLFMDCDMVVKEGMLGRYLATEGADVVDGGVAIGKGPAGNLRYLYEKSCEQHHTAAERRKRPYQHFHTANFMISRPTMLATPFDERYRRYGYEDVVFGKQLAEKGIRIEHIDNPAGFDRFETNEHFVAKTEEGLQTLFCFSSELRGYSRMLTFVGGIHVPLVKTLLRTWHRLFGRLERRLLCSSHPSLAVFKAYKIGYYLSLTKTD